MEEDRVRAIKESLEEERRSIERQLADCGVAVDRDDVELAVDEGGFADSAQATAERSELLSLIESLRAQRAGVIAALTSIEEGTYGKCERCGTEIPIERLEAIPTATLCVSCKQTAA